MTDTTWTWPNSKIVRVIDGDTIDASVTRDLGFGGVATFVVRLRLNRVNAPSLSTAAGKAAEHYLSDCVAGDPVATITTVKPYKYGGPDGSPGEWMAEVVDRRAVNLSDAMVNAGHAVYWDGQGARPADG